jgi:hypothetical protein
MVGCSPARFGLPRASSGEPEEAVSFGCAGSPALFGWGRESNLQALGMISHSLFCLKAIQ